MVDTVIMVMVDMVEVRTAFINQFYFTTSSKYFEVHCPSIYLSVTIFWLAEQNMASQITDRQNKINFN